MKKYWEFPLIFATSLCLCQCGSLPGGNDSDDDAYDHIETVGDAEQRGEFASGLADAVDGTPPTDVEVDDRLDAAVFVVNIDGERRNIVIQLNASAAPQTVLNFKRNVKRGYYDGLAFHRVIPNYLVQAGDPLTRDEFGRSEWGTGGPGYTIPAEPGQPHVKGAVAMARLDDTLNPNRESSGSQFYICLRKLSKFDGNYTVFGNVIQGLDALNALSNVATDENDVPNNRVEIASAKLVSSKSRFVRAKAKEKKAPNAKPDAQKGGFEKLIERIW